MFSYDKRCYECVKDMIMPKFNYKHQICCGGVINELNANDTCCCGEETIDPKFEICCDGVPEKRDKKVAVDCCNCGLTKVDIVVVLDASESIQLPNWPKMLTFTTEILGEAEIDEDNVRVGLLTYRHNASVEFNLNEYHKKDAMFGAIKSVPYVRGSTNTGFAIETAREKMFIPSKGDRPNVDDVLIIVTDGDSDDYDYTIEQAKLARDSGIHIFAIGIALKNLTELKNIASPPAEQNVLSINDFDNLKTLKGKIFASICTGTPVPNPFEKCGKKEYFNPKEDLCCDGNPVPIITGENTKCCGQNGFNEKTQICCNGVVNDLRGPNTVCCGKTAMDPKAELCCGQSPVKRPSLAYDECCGTHAYNPNTEVCCAGTVSKAFGDPSKDTDCCGPFSYDTRCFMCAPRNKIKPLFDTNCQLCCDGSIQNLTSDDNCCCGKKIFSPAGGDICCDNKLRARKGEEKKHSCCECGSALVDLALVIDSSESVGAANWELLIDFVQSVIRNSDVDDGSTRIALEVYRHNVSMEFKFSNYGMSSSMIEHVKKIKYVRGSTNTGLALEEMREKIFVPKAGDRPNVPDIAVVILDGSSDDPRETKRQAALAKEAGIHIYAIAVGLNIDDELKSIASEPWEQNVFTTNNFEELKSLNKQLLEIVSDVCPQQPTPNKCKEPCGKKMYDPKTELCCDGEPQLFHGGSAENTKCCGTEAYSVQDEMCCNGNVNVKPGNRKKAEAECCGDAAYNPRDSMCCRGKDVIPISGKGASDCCGMSTFNPIKELCCEDVIYENFGPDGKSGACCKLADSNKTVSYDTRCYQCKKGELQPLYDCAFERCCDGVIQKIEYQNSCCCGKKAFNLDEFTCCDGKLSKRKKDDDPGCCECASSIADIVIVLDSSESVGLENWRRMEMFVEDLISASTVPDTRFGLLTYKHNTSIEFHMNRYFDVPSLLEAVDNLPYVRGSTNTGLALQVAREQMLIPMNGDRPSAPDFILLITDGQSDEPLYTKEQADLVKEQGIQIIALGVGLKDVKELRAVASPPADVNAISLKNFDELEVVKQRIFNDLAKSVCPQRPKERCGLPCGDTVYDPLTQVCCNERPQPIQGGSAENTKCCDQQSYNVKTEMCCGKTTVYNIKTEMCCNKKVNEKPPGKNPECCDDEAYNPDEAICCYGNSVIEKSSKDATECCGMATYDPVKELCCDDAIYMNYGDEGESGACCTMRKTNVTVSYDIRCYECVNGELVPLYDCAYQRCCDGVIQEIYGDTSCCCGKIAFDPTTQICCNKKIRNRKPEDDKRCCECAGKIVDIVIVLDSSESVGEDNWRRMETFVESLIGSSKFPDVRFGLLTYRHNASIEFNLNKFFDKTSLLDAVDKLPYIRGSTNTGLALQVMRQKMFTTQAGDRPTAPNFALVITDGQSDNPADTKKQADLVKNQGIHVLALGIGLKDAKELNEVASPPSEENAIALKNFDELKVVKNRIFNDLSKGACPQQPEKRCGTPCGNTTIDERYYICCEGVPHKRMAGSNTQCCGTEAYDPNCFICCEENNLVSKYAGNFTECCCKWAYDSRTHLCCGNHILPLVAGKFTLCCHNETYDTRTQVCCDNIMVQPSFGESTKCCNGKSYDSDCDDCAKNNITPRYDVNEELCCGGKIQKKQFEERSCCCGTKQFDVDKGICCEEKYFDRPKGDEVTCCGSNIHNPKKEICCNDEVNPRLSGFETKCCGNTSYNPSKSHCCDDKLNKKKSKGDTCCCGSTVFDFSKMICCDGQVSKLSKPGNRSSSVCCGKRSFDPTKQICCKNTVNKLGVKGASTACCEKKAYNPAKQVCENGKVTSIKKECNNRFYNPETQMCCNGYINNGTIKDPWARCCFGDAYDAREKVCCCNGNLEEAIAGIYTQCCYSMAYDSRTHTCCDGQIVRKPYPSAECCCERQAYDSNREICCGGKVNACGSDRTKCCDTEAYDPVLEICCDGKLHDRKYGADTYCCGEDVYTPTLAACCGNRIAYRRKINLEW
ncbi:uncharacterized protein LOC123529337 [Mercenaria mercenaria]|uniref:uncharacterized protein LOC123529337 n=1 Tax=Mercenaria mercenaria TaxID=6596 RepID=UPI00234F3E8C|nr:uncharacterized protein LOC123529337 [Mercenaria mercenaria]